MKTQFQEVTTPEPHRRRRKPILAQYPSIRVLFGYDWRTTFVTVAVVTAQLAVTAVLVAVFAESTLLVKTLALTATAFVVGAVLNHWLAMSIHEATHNLAARSVRQNIALGFFANLPLVLPVAMTFRRYHLEHHAQLGVPCRDTDLPHAWEVRHIGNSTWRKAIWWAFNALVYLGRGATFAKNPNRLEWLNIAFMLVVNISIGFTWGGTALSYLLLSTFFAHGLHPVAVHFIHEHYIFAPGQETYSYYGPLNAVTFNVGYHNEHHDFPNVPGWQLPQLHALAREYYAPLKSHTSWTKLILKFIADPSLGFGSRIVRASVHGAKGC